MAGELGMTADHLGAEAVRLAQSSLRCEIVDDVFSVLRDGDAALTGLDEIRCPVLVTWGDHDRILPVERHSPRLRAEIPGKFSALPTKAGGMYAPELKANSDEVKLRIAD